MSFIHAAVILLTLALTHAAIAGDRINGRIRATRSPVIAKHGAAATSQPLATQIAIDILKQGGSAVDAAIAANAALGLMEPTGCGIGGDLFAIVWDAEQKELVGLNASGRSPQALSIETLRADGRTEIPKFGPLPVSTPGCVSGWIALHERYGKLPLEQVLAPAIQYAEEGFPVSQLIAYYWDRGARVFSRYPGFNETFLPNGRAPRQGEIFKNPALANTYRRIAATNGRDFYHGEIAQRIDAFCRAHGCYLRAADLASHSSDWTPPVSTTYRGYTVWQLPPNGQGIAGLQMLNLLEPVDLRALGHNSTAYLHHLIEAKKIAYEDRAQYYADPDFAQLPIQQLISKEYAAQRRAWLNPDRATRRIPPSDLPWSAIDAKLRDSDTIYLTVADKDRYIVSLIQSNFRGFGSGLCPTDLGFCLQNRGELFTLADNHPNTYAPGKRPFHTIIPAFVTKDGKPFLSFGVMGGDMQPQGHVQVLCNIIDFGMNVQEAGDAPRFHHGGSSEPTGTTMTDGGSVALESQINAQVRRELEQRGHRLEDRPGVFGGYQAIMYDHVNDVFWAASESRKDGHAAGY